MKQPEAYHAHVLDYAAGALGPAGALLFDSHRRLSAGGAASIAAAEALGGGLLEALAPTPVRDEFSPTRVPATPVDPRLSAASLKVAAAASGELLGWRWKLPGLRTHTLPIPGAMLVRFGAHQGLPEHGHSGDEMTLVLRGAFEDEAGRYERGDIAFADSAVHHSVAVVGEEECVCLVAMSGGWRFKDPLARLAALLIR